MKAATTYPSLALCISTSYQIILFLSIHSFIQWRNSRGGGQSAPLILLAGKFLLTYREKREKNKKKRENGEEKKENRKTGGEKLKMEGKKLAKVKN